MSKETEIAQEFNEGYDCSMVVLKNLAKEIGLTEEQGLRLGSCFGVGMMQGSICGAVTGAMIAIGYKYGNVKKNDFAQKGLCMAKRDEFITKFKAKHGDIVCPKLLNGLDLRNPEDMKKANELQLLSKDCPKFCVDAIQIVKEILD